jgi:hypothetical protein
VSSFSKSSEAETGAWWARACYAYALAVAAVTAYFLLGIPIQLTDSYGNLLEVSDVSLRSLVYNQFFQRAFLRPFLWANTKIVYTLADGHYFEWFRGWHVAQVMLLVLLFVRLVRPRTAAAAAAVPAGLAALIGIHTFAGTVREAFPINTFMTILLCCFAAADLALGAPRWWRTALAWLLFAFAVLTVESGLLVAVVLVAAYAAGARGVSRAGIAGIVVLVAGYFYLRFVYLAVGAPDLVERSSGFGFAYVDPKELAARFSANPAPFYAYNVMASIGSVLLSEPRGGVFAVTRDLLAGEWTPAQVVDVVGSAVGTILIGAYAWGRRVAWRRCEFTRGDQITLVFAAVLVANAAISYAYTKDVIMSPAGAFFALALTVAVQDVVERMPRRSGARAVLLAFVLVVLSGAWAVRAVGADVGLRSSALAVRNEWVYADGWIRDEHLPTTPAAVRLKEQLQGDAIARHPAPPALLGDWLAWMDE